jgi:hypothetical protein
MEECFKVIKKTIRDKSALCYVSEKQIPGWEKYIQFTEDFCAKYDYDPNLFSLNVRKCAIFPLLSYQKDSEVYVKTCEKIAKTLRSKHGVTRETILSFMGVKPPAPKIRTTITVNPATPRLVIKGNKKSEIVVKNQTLLSILDPPYISILQDEMIKNNLDTEYAALIRVLTKVRK